MEVTDKIVPAPVTTTKAHGDVISHRGPLKIFRIVLPLGGALPEHPAADDLIIIGIRGIGTILVEQEVRHVSAGEVIELRRGDRHSVDAESELELVVIQGPQPPI